MGTLWPQLLTHMFSPWSEDVHVVWIYSLHYFLSLFPLTSDSMKVYRQWVSCEHKSFWNFARFLSGLEMCMWFGYNPWIIFCYFFHFVNFVIFWPQILWKCVDSGYFLITTPYTISYLNLCKFAHFFHGLKMCMWVGFILYSRRYKI